MKKKVILFALFILHFAFFIGLSAQGTWTHTYDPFYMDAYGGHDVVKCSDGGYVINGSCYIEDSWNPGNYLEHYGFLFKVDNEGNLQWAKKDTVSFIALNQGSALVQTPDSGFISAVIPLYAGQCALIKRDSYGNREWVINPGLWVHSIANTNDGNIVIVGGDYEGLVFQKWSLLGEVIWTKSFDDTNLKSVFTSQDEGFLLTGYKDADGGPFDKDIVVIKTDADGDTLWTRIYDAYEEWDQGNSVIETNNGEMLIVGRVSIPNTAGFLWLLDSLGNTIWTEEADNDFAWAHWSVAEYQENEYITFCIFNYDGKFYGFDGDYNILWEMENVGGAGGDRCFCVDGEYIIWPESGTSFILHKDIPDQGSVSEDLINSKPFFLSNYPNPFNPQTTIYYTIKQPGDVKIDILNVKGQKIKTLIHEYQKYGEHKITWDGTNERDKFVSSGVYFVVLSFNSQPKTTQKILLIK